jgi:hypothetical protein
LLSKLEQKQFEMVCTDHVWGALCVHSASRSPGRKGAADWAALSVRRLVEASPSYRACWQRVKPLVRRQGFSTFIAIVEGKAGSAGMSRPDAGKAQGSAARPVPGPGTPDSRPMAAPATATRRRIEADGAVALPLAKLHFVCGALAGREIELTKVLTQIGRTGVQVAAISRRKEGYYIASVEPGTPKFRLLVNGISIGSGARALSDNDLIQIGNIRARFVQQAVSAVKPKRLMTVA